jgi:hypothetical protein
MESYESEMVGRWIDRGIVMNYVFIHPASPLPHLLNAVHASKGSPSYADNKDIRVEVPVRDINQRQNSAMAGQFLRMRGAANVPRSGSSMMWGSSGLCVTGAWYSGLGSSGATQTLFSLSLNREFG